MKCSVQFWCFMQMSLISHEAAVWIQVYLCKYSAQRLACDKLSVYITIIISMKWINPFRIGKLANAPREQSENKPTEVWLLLMIMQPLHPKFCVCAKRFRILQTIFKIILYLSALLSFCYGLWPKAIQFWQNMYIRKPYKNSAHGDRVRHCTVTSQRSSDQRHSGRPSSFGFKVFSFSFSITVDIQYYFMLVSGVQPSVFFLYVASYLTSAKPVALSSLIQKRYELWQSSVL